MRYIRRINEKNSPQVKKRSVHSHFSQGQTEGQVTLAFGYVSPREKCPVIRVDLKPSVADVGATHFASLKGVSDNIAVF